MALQASGAISLADIATEFGGTTPHSLSEYYGVDTGVPASGAIDLADFYGTSSIYTATDNISIVDNPVINSKTGATVGTYGVKSNDSFSATPTRTFKLFRRNGTGNYLGSVDNECSFYMSDSTNSNEFGTRTYPEALSSFITRISINGVWYAASIFSQESYGTPLQYSPKYKVIGTVPMPARGSTITVIIES